MNLGRQGGTGWWIEQVGSGSADRFLIFFARAECWDKKGRLVTYGLTQESALTKARERSKKRTEGA